LGISDRFASKGQYGVLSGEESTLSGETEVAVGSDWVVGSGVYVVDEVCESGGKDVQKVLGGIRQDGTQEEIWEHMQSEFLRVTGKSAIQ
jgi:hypothetical protein